MHAGHLLHVPTINLCLEYSLVRPLDAPRLCLRRFRSTCEPLVEVDRRSAIAPRESSSVVASCALYSHPRLRFGRRSVLEASSFLTRYEQHPHFWGDVPYDAESK